MTSPRRRPSTGSAAAKATWSFPRPPHWSSSWRGTPLPASRGPQTRSTRQCSIWSAVEDIAHLFAEYRHTAFRLETRRGYATDRAGARFQAFMRGVDPAPEPDNAWHVNVRERTAQGGRFSRVRIIDEPPTDGQRFLMASATANASMGEDIRVLARAQAVHLELPDYDFWLFDSRILVRFHIDEQDVTTGVEVIDDPADVLAACRARDRAWPLASPSTEVWTQVRSSV
ncbi:DUF6879 family protein [Streptomyces sp. NBC_00424]|uniref:DUF6879 family protein n=1 Tax=unclassified Streptomyces TaxID=2593676 RepID=UPI002B1E4E42|nr:DUF6879 family protein [Streptomyces sp. NBC_00424]